MLYPPHVSARIPYYCVWCKLCQELQYKLYVVVYFVLYTKLFIELYNVLYMCCSPQQYAVVLCMHSIVVLVGVPLMSYLFISSQP